MLPFGKLNGELNLEITKGDFIGIKGDTNKPRVIPPPYPDIPETTDAKKAVNINIVSSITPRLANNAPMSKSVSIRD